MSESRLRESPSEPKEEIPKAEAAPDEDLEKRIDIIDDQLRWTNYGTISNTEDIKRIRKDLEDIGQRISRLKTISFIMLAMCCALATVLMIHLFP